MFVYLSADCIIDSKNIIGIFDLDSATVSKKTRDMLSQAEKQGRVVTVSFDLPKSFIVSAENNGNQTVYLLPFTPVTVIKKLSVPDTVF